MRRLIGILLLALAMQPASGAETANLEGVGYLRFPTSGAPDAQAHFLRGVAILHSFGWKQAITEFQAAQALDPDFAMAYWGESLCYNHPLIREQDLESPRAVLSRLADSPEGRLAKAPTDREKGFIRAVEALFFGEGDTAARRTAYMEAMRTLYDRYPADDEVAAFYAVSLLSAAGPAGGAGHRLNVLAGAIGLEITARNPEHPGAVHYTIHAFDDPVHARLALPAALRFADIAGAVSHAQHMPSHIFIQLGMWDRVSASNESAYQVAVNLWEPGDSAGDMTHALDWGQYGDLQRGDYERARAWIERMERIVRDNAGQGRVTEALPRVRARYVLETEGWKTSPVTAESPAPELLATGISAVHLEDYPLARAAAERLGELAAAATKDRDSSYYSQTGQPLAIMHAELAGLLAVAKGDPEKGLALLKEGVATAESMRPPNGAPNPVKPVHELLGEVMLAQGDAAGAVTLFEKSLLRTPNRPRSLLGLARAHVALGNSEAAAASYKKLAAVWTDRDFPALEEARPYLAAQAD
jgi:tetratricopeptide (TPR) repeat protein